MSPGRLRELGVASIRFIDRAGYDLIGRSGTKPSKKWADGLRTHHGLTIHDFPNCFGLGFTQTGVTPNATHRLDDQASQMAYIVQQVRTRGATVVEATAEGETNRNGFISGQYGGAVKFFRLLEEWRAEGSLSGLEIR